MYSNLWMYRSNNLILIWWIRSISTSTNELIIFKWIAEIEAVWNLEKVLGKTGAIFILIQTLRQWHKEHKVINLHDCVFLILWKIIHVFMNFDLIFLCEWIWCYIVKANCRKEYVYNHAYETHFHRVTSSPFEYLSTVQ